MVFVLLVGVYTRINAAQVLARLKCVLYRISRMYVGTTMRSCRRGATDKTGYNVLSRVAFTAHRTIIARNCWRLFLQVNKILHVSFKITKFLNKLAIKKKTETLKNKFPSANQCQQ